MTEVIRDIEKDELLRMYHEMVLVRRLEERAAALYQEGKIGGFLHLYIGQEAVSTGVLSVRRPEDRVITAYRDHGTAISCGRPAWRWPTSTAGSRPSPCASSATAQRTSATSTRPSTCRWSGTFPSCGFARTTSTGWAPPSSALRRSSRSGRRPRATACPTRASRGWTSSRSGA